MVFLVNGEVAEELIKNLTLTEKADQPQGQVGIDDGPDQPGDKEPLGDIGENYFKPATAADVVTDEETGIKYVRNQLLISAYLGTPRVAIEEIAEELGAEIVGYTAITCDYQFEFTEDKTLDDLDAIAEYLGEYPYISGVFLNTVVEEICDYNSNDFFYKDGLQCVKKYADGNGDGDTFDDEDYDYIELVTPSVASNQDVWDEVNPGGDNWNLEMLHVPSAWDLVVDSHNVKVGVIDNYFEDVVYPSGKIELEFADIVRNVNFNPKNHKLAHGDHVAGIIAARHNNNYGISGVATNVTLYGYTMRTKDLDASGDVDVNSMAGVNVALNTLICNHVKVINMSLGYGDGTKVYGASQGNTKAIQAIEEDVSIITEHLRKLTDAGYDFLITKSAGNWNDEYFVKDSSTFGYHIYQSGVDDASKKEGGLDSDPTHIAKAMYGHYINAISDPVLRERIVVVGAFGKGMSALAAMSGRGDGLDVAAPGVAILSTVPRSLDISAAGSRAIPGYKIWQGTSMATPHIAGIAALMFQVKPSIPARTVKRFLTADENAVKQIGGVNVPNAEKCVKKAINVLDTPGFDEDWPTGLLAGSVGDASSNKISRATINIQAVRHSTGDYNLDRYAFNFTSDKNGDFLYPLPQGTYDILVYINGNSYLPTVIKDVEINPDETTYLETIRLSTWSSKASGSVKGIVNDAITGSALKGVTVKIRKGWNVTSGGYVTTLLGSAKTDTTSADGKFSISAPIGAYTVELVKSGYITAYYNVLSTPGNASSVGYDTTMSMTPVLPDDEYRIVLTWGSTPSDLDSHLFYYKNGKQQFHVCYWNKVAYLNGQKVANLDLDDTSSYGPETITITVDADLVENGELHYCVHNYSGGSASALSDSGATVRIYRGNQLEKTYNITRNREGMVWHVFKIDENGIETDYTFDNIIN